MKRLSKEQILMLHSQLIAEFGGSDGAVLVGFKEDEWKNTVK